jgi:hypothetical protein
MQGLGSSVKNTIQHCVARGLLELPAYLQVVFSPGTESTPLNKSLTEKVTVVKLLSCGKG